VRTPWPPPVSAQSPGVCSRECVIAVNCDGGEEASRGVGERLVSAARPLGQVVLHTQRSAFDRVVCSADCAVVVIPWLDMPAAGLRVEQIRSGAPEVPIVVVTSKALENARRAVELGVTSAVWLSDVEQQLPCAIRFALEQSFLRLAGANAERASHLSATVRGTVATACRSRTPVRSLEELAVLVGVHRTALVSAWRGISHRELTPKRVLDWVLLLHATSRKTSRVSWESVAVELRASEDTLARIAMRLLGGRLSELNAATIERVRRGFVEDVLAPLGIRAPARTR
jgi:hypothetical protein